MIKFLLFLTVFYGSSGTLPPYIKVCKKSTPNIAQCIINSINELKPKLAEGISELNVPPMEPLPLEEIKLRSGANSAKIDANITNLLVWGASSFEILELKPNIAKHKFAAKINVPHVYFKGDYDMDLNILVLKYKGQGPITGNFTNLMANIILKGHLEKIDGQNHLVFSKFNIQMVIEKSHLHLGNLFQQDPNLGRATNNVVNDNSDVFINEIKPALESSLAEKFTEVANSINSTSLMMNYSRLISAKFLENCDSIVYTG